MIQTAGPRPKKQLRLFPALVALAVVASFMPAEMARANSHQDGSCSLIPGNSMGVGGSTVDSGSSSNPIAIPNEAQLRELSECTQLNSGSTNSVHYQLTSDISLQDLGAPNWTPIGQTDSARFLGVFSGGGHSITGIRVGDLEYAGLFGAVGPDSVITNLVASGSVSGRYAGLVAGSAKSGAKFLSISAEVVIHSTALDLSDSAAGGVLGMYDGEGSSGGDRRQSTFSHVSSVTSGTVNHQRIGGLIGAHSYYPGTLRIENSFATLSIFNTQPISGNNVSTGGLVGRAESTRIYRSSAKVSVVSSDYGIRSAGSGPLHSLGGLVGTGFHVQLLESFSKASLVAGGRSQLGGLIGYASYENSGWPSGTSIGSTGISGSYAVSIFREKGTSQLAIGGLVGTEGGHSSTRYENNVSLVRVYKEGSTSRVGGLIGYDAGVTLGSSNTLNQYWSKGSNMPAVAIGIIDSGGSYTEVPGSRSVGIQESSFGTASSFPGLDISTNGFDASKNWSICEHPFLSWQGSDGCAPEFLIATLGTNGTTITLESFTGISSASFDSARLTVLADGLIATHNSDFTGAGFAATFSLADQQLSSTALKISLDNSPGSGAVVASNGTTPFLSLTNFPVVNRSSLTSPNASFGNSTMTPTSIDIGLSCGGSCGPGNSYTYVASITPTGGSPTTISGTANSTVTTLSFTALTPSVSHTIQASVTYNGQTSATVSTTVVTPRPAATISALTVTDTSANLTVDCTNCSAAPDSFVITATPQGGGTPITSTTNQVSGLTPETTYSFAVVITYAGVTSTSVNWQSNPVMTLPLVPVITTVSPGAIALTGNNNIRVIGSNFLTSNAVTLDGAAVSFTIVSGTEITISAPAKTAGSYDLAITNQVGTYTSSNAVTYVSGPRITATSPFVGTTNGGTIVSITGTDLVRTSEVSIGDNTVSFTVLSDTLVRFVTPASSSGTVSIRVTTPGGSTTSPVAFEYTTSALVPVVSTITPVTGPTAGGTTITVTGQYFSGSYSDSVSAAINGVSGSSIVLINDSTLTLVSPPGAAATGLDVTVATGGGVGTLAGAFSYTAPPAPSTPGSAPPVVINTPTITEFSTREISATGASVTAIGLRLENVSLLTLGGITVTIVSNTATSLTFTTGEMPVGVWDLRLVGSNGTLVFQQAIEVVETTAIVAESTGELLGYTWTLKFLGNSRSLHDAQEAHLTRRLNPNAETIICWGYTTSSSPNAWAIAHATQRAQAACDLARANNSEVKTVVRLRYGVEKSWAMRSALQFWR